jgi:hypothetical protein
MGIDAFSRKFAGDLRGTQTEARRCMPISPPASSPKMTALPQAGPTPASSFHGRAWVQFGGQAHPRAKLGRNAEISRAIEAANSDYLWKNKSGIPYGDWLSPEGCDGRRPARDCLLGHMTPR